MKTDYRKQTANGENARAINKPQKPHSDPGQRHTRTPRENDAASRPRFVTPTVPIYDVGLDIELVHPSPHRLKLPVLLHGPGLGLLGHEGREEDPPGPVHPSPWSQGVALRGDSLRHQEDFPHADPGVGREVWQRHLLRHGQEERGRALRLRVHRQRVQELRDGREAKQRGLQLPRRIR